MRMRSHRNASKCHVNYGTKDRIHKDSKLALTRLQETFECHDGQTNGQNNRQSTSIAGCGQRMTRNSVGRSTADCRGFREFDYKCNLEFIQTPRLAGKKESLLSMMFHVICRQSPAKVIKFSVMRTSGRAGVDLCSLSVGLRELGP